VKGSEFMDYACVKGKIIANREAVPGHFKMTIEAPFIARTARPGQFVMVKTGEGDVPLLRRPFGIYRADKEGRSIEILYRIVGLGTRLLSEMPSGAGLEIIGPLGNGFDVNAAGDAPLLVAGGVGVASLLPLAEALTSAGADAVTLIGVRRSDELLAVAAFENAGAGVKIATEDGSRGYRGYVTDLMDEIIGSQEGCSAVYSCGPQPMLKKVASISARYGVPCQVSLEATMACGFGVCLGCIVKTGPDGSQYKRVCREGPVFNAEEIAWNET